MVERTGRETGCPGAPLPAGAARAAISATVARAVRVARGARAVRVVSAVGGGSEAGRKPENGPAAAYSPGNSEYKSVEGATLLFHRKPNDKLPHECVLSLGFVRLRIRAPFEFTALRAIQGCLNSNGARISRQQK